MKSHGDQVVVKYVTPCNKKNSPYLPLTNESLIVYTKTICFNGESNLHFVPSVTKCPVCDILY